MTDYHTDNPCIGSPDAIHSIYPIENNYNNHGDNDNDDDGFENYISSTIDPRPWLFQEVILYTLCCIIIQWDGKILALTGICTSGGSFYQEQISEREAGKSWKVFTYYKRE